MGADLLISFIAAPAGRTDPLHFDAGRRRLQQVTTIDDFNENFDESALIAHHPDRDIDAHISKDGVPTLAAAKIVGSVIIDQLEEAVVSRYTTEILIGGYEVFISGGLSWGDIPTDEAQAIDDAYLLPEAVLQAIGFAPDCQHPPASTGAAVTERS